MTILSAPSDPRVAAVDDDVDIDRDRILVTLAQAGNDAAFDDLYARYYRRLWRFCFKRLHDEHEAEDVTQEAFARAWQALDGFAGQRRFYPWLSVIASHLCSNVIRKRNRSDPVADFGERHLASWEGCGEDHIVNAHDGAMAAAAFAQLSPRHQQILELRESRGWSYQRIADHEGVRVSTVESLLWRAREALRREYANQSGEGRMAGLAGAALLSLRRWMRSPQAVIQQGSGIVPAGTSMAMSSAVVVTSAMAAAVTTLAAVVGSVVPSPGPRPAPPAPLVASTGAAMASSRFVGPPASSSTVVLFAPKPGAPPGSPGAGSGVSATTPSPSVPNSTGLPSVPATPSSPSANVPSSSWDLSPQTSWPSPPSPPPTPSAPQLQVSGVSVPLPQGTPSVPLNTTSSLPATPTLPAGVTNTVNSATSTLSPIVSGA